MKAVKLIILCLFLSACATTPKVVYVKSPVQCPEPTIEPEPNYLINQLTPADKNDYPKISKAWVGSLQQCRGALKVCTTQLEGYRHE